MATLNSNAREQPIILDYEPISYVKLAHRFARKMPKYTKNYITGLFPIVFWISRYNLTWLIHDIIAGVTVGVVVVPQGMGYAKIAELPPEYGLYSSFVGLCIYCFFGTSKDISIGPTAVMSLLVGQCITRVVTEGSTYTGPEVAYTLALFGGIIAVAIGLVRLGILVDFIPEPAIAGFMTGSSITITIGQFPKLFGMHKVNTHDDAYLIFGNFFKHLPDTRVDVAFGLVGLLWLYGVKYLTIYLGKKYPRYDKLWFMFSIMRNGLLVVFGTLIAYLVQLGKSKSPVSILGYVPSGFTAMGVPKVNVGLLSKVAGSLPSVVIILILEHVAIAKSFGRINNYKIVADQEIIAIGVANIIGSFFGAYPNTGSFSRTAIKARSGVRTPIAGIFSAVVVLLALYALTPAFRYIPDAILAAVIIHAVADLASGPKFVQHLWNINPLELFTFVAAVIITFFTTVEYGIYVSVGLSIFFMLIRIARPRYAILGRIPIRSPRKVHSEHGDANEHDLAQDTQYIYVKENHQTLRGLVEPPPPGVLIFRFDESLTYPNAGFISDKIMHYVQDNFTSGQPPPTKKGDRAWNDPRPLVKKEDLETAMAEQETSARKLGAIVLDFSGVNFLDSTGVQALLDLRLAINRYTGREVEWHFASLASPFIRHALITGGFGKQNGRETHPTEILPVVPPTHDVSLSGPCLERLETDISEKPSRYYSMSLAMSDTTDSSVTASSDAGSLSIRSSPTIKDDQDSVMINTHSASPTDTQGGNPRHTAHYHILERGVPIDRYPFFHWDLEDAVRAAARSARDKI